MSFDNSIRGMAWKPRAISKDEIQKLRDNHVWSVAPSLENVEMIFATADSMDDHTRYGVWAWTTDDCLYLLEDGDLPYIELSEEKRKEINAQLKADGKPPIVTLDDVLEKDYCFSNGSGIKITFMLMDQGGHITEDVKHFAKFHPNVFMQKGTNLSSINWKKSDNQEKLIISNEKFWKSTAIYYLYAQKNHHENYLYFHPTITEESLAEIRDVMPDPSSKWGDAPENWQAKTGKSHLFDCLKYAYLARDFALQSFKKMRYRFGKSPLILKRFDKLQKQQESKQRAEIHQSDWFKV